MNMNKNRKKDISNSRASSTVPEGFSLAMAIVDCLPGGLGHINLISDLCGII